VTVHDLAFERLPEAFDRAYRTFAHRQHRAAARRAFGMEDLAIDQVEPGFGFRPVHHQAAGGALHLQRSIAWALFSITATT